jgi:long-subunit fatty acid transport protein
VEGDIAEDQKTKLAVSPIVGIQVRPTERLTLGLTYRRELYMDDYGTNHVEVLIKPQDSNPLKVTFDYDHHFAHYYTPDQWAAGVRYTFGKGAMLSAEAAYMQWSTFLDWLHERPIPRFKDVFAFKVGGEKQIIERNTYLGDVILRAGYGFWKSPVPEQRGETNFLDNDKRILAVGVECRRENLGTWWTKPVSVQAMAQYHYLVERSYTKDISGEKLTFGGYADAAGISMEFEF